ncbi:four-helix bundle copper-binding protein [Undibacterium arcticum]|uniref:Four-helix bundle copper-binding protein n=1 Tax=Undibacterium arcticum TaxID=1762892 RepID=A0ABV7F8M6_9BURK
MISSQLSAGMHSCLTHSLACHRRCTETAAHVLHGANVHSEAKHLVALLDCAQMCMVHADFMMRRSPHHVHLAKESAEICDACAALCEQHPEPDGEMARCAEACRSCAQSCREMRT